MKVYTVASAKGGVGKSVFCVNLGRMLAQHNKSVLLVDMDIGVRSLDILLGVSQNTVYNWGDILKDNCDFKKPVLEVSRNLFLLPAPLDFSDDYDEDEFNKLMDRYRHDFDYVLLDSPAGLEIGFNLSVKSADEVILISTPDGVSIRAASYAAKSVRALGIKNVRLVVNKFNKKFHKQIDVDEIIDTVGARLLGIIPDSIELYNSVYGEKVPYDCKGNQAFYRIFKRLEGESVPFKAKNI